MRTCPFIHPPPPKKGVLGVKTPQKLTLDVAVQVDPVDWAVASLIFVAFAAMIEVILGKVGGDSGGGDARGDGYSRGPPSSAPARVVTGSDAILCLFLCLRSLHSGFQACLSIHEPYHTLGVDKGDKVGYKWGLQVVMPCLCRHRCSVCTSGCVHGCEGGCVSRVLKFLQSQTRLPRPPLLR